MEFQNVGAVLIYFRGSMTDQAWSRLHDSIDTARHLDVPFAVMAFQIGGTTMDVTLMDVKGEPDSSKATDKD